MISAGEYELMRAWFAHFFANYMSLPIDRPEHHPIAILDSYYAKSRVIARRGLAMAINDALEMTAFFTLAQVQAADADFAQAGLPTLSELRARFWRHIQSALKRGRIRGEVEYYAVRNDVEAAQSDEERDRLWMLLDEFEQRIVRQLEQKTPRSKRP